MIVRHVYNKYALFISLPSCTITTHVMVGVVGFVISFWLYFQIRHIVYKFI